MRYSDTHGEETRRKVVRAAAAAARAHGPDGVSVAGVMAQVGLTHGGFYAHFPSKEALLVAAVEEAFGASARRFARLTAGLTGPQALSLFVDAYVSLEHRAAPERGCPIASLSSDLPRQAGPIRQAYEGGVRRLIARIEGWLPDARKPQAASLLAEMMGAVALSRALASEADAEAMLASSRVSLKARMGIGQ